MPSDSDAFGELVRDMLDDVIERLKRLEENQLSHYEKHGEDRAKLSALETRVTLMLAAGSMVASAVVAVIVAALRLVHF